MQMQMDLDSQFVCQATQNNTLATLMHEKVSRYRRPTMKEFPEGPMHNLNAAMAHP